MKKFTSDTTKEMSMQAPNYVAILAIVGEMARRVNENISKVDLKPLQQALSAREEADTTASNS
jgi:predicted translin family RNA/ssDNA-binding protein